MACLLMCQTKNMTKNLTADSDNALKYDENFTRQSAAKRIFKWGNFDDAVGELFCV
jgi:hypothetical protein